MGPSSVSIVTLHAPASVPALKGHSGQARGEPVFNQPEYITLNLNSTTSHPTRRSATRTHNPQVERLGKSVRYLLQAETMWAMASSEIRPACNTLQYCVSRLRMFLPTGVGTGPSRLAYGVTQSLAVSVLPSPARCWLTLPCVRFVGAALFSGGRLPLHTA